MNYYMVEASCYQTARQAQKEIKQIVFRYMLTFGIIFGILLFFGIIFGKDIKEYLRHGFFAFLFASIISAVCFATPWCFFKLSMARLRRQILANAEEE